MLVRSSQGIAGIGVLVNILYWSFDILKFGSSHLTYIHFLEKFTEHFIIIGLIPIFCVLGFLVSKMEEQEERYRAVFNEANDGIVLVDSETGGIVECNPEFELICGRKSGDLKTMKIWDIRPPEKKESTKEKFFEIKGKGAGGSSDLGILRPSGEVVPVEFKTKVVKIGGKTYNQSIMRDITSRKEAEHALEKSYGELKSIDELKTNIIANVSHELRTPLTTMQGALEMAVEDATDPTKKDFYHMAIGSLRRQNWIIEDLITSAHINAKKFDILKSPLNISTVINDAREIVHEKARANSIQLITEIENDLPPVMADKKRLQHAITHLLDNAIKFNKEDGKVRIVALVSGIELLISVSDEGLGIAGEEIGKIFSPLTQLDPGINRKFNGTGTGLAISKHLIEAHNGRIWVESKGKGLGATFYISLPLRGDADQ